MRTFIIVTTDANELVTPIHNRILVILSLADHAAWLGGDTVCEVAELFVRRNWVRAG